MLKFTSVRNGLRLTKGAITHLKRNGINTPQKAEALDIVDVTRGTINTRIFTFRDKDNYLLKRLKIDENSESGVKNVQARFYEYLGELGDKRRLNRVSAYDFGENNRCKNFTNWDFYYPYNTSSVWFSRRTKDGAVNNFPKTSDYLEDASGFRVKPISIAEFLDIEKTLGRKCIVDEPWTLNQTITTNIAATDCIRECTAVGIVGKKGITLNHLNPNNPQNRDITEIEKALKEQIEYQGKDAKAFMLGSVEIDTPSNIQFWGLRKILEKTGIPFSVYKTGDSTVQEFINTLPRGLALVKQIKNGLMTPFYLHSSQHIVCSGNEIKVANLIIDKELARGNRNAADMIKKSFAEIV